MPTMNTTILTKISKFTLIGSTSAFLSFAAKSSPEVKLFGIYLYGGIVTILTLAILWEGRNEISVNPDDTEGINGLIKQLSSSVTTTKSKRHYLLSPTARLELVIAIAIITISALVGSI